MRCSCATPCAVSCRWHGWVTGAGRRIRRSPTSAPALPANTPLFPIPLRQEVLVSRKPKSRSGGSVLFLLLVLGALAYWGWQRYTGFADAPLSGIESGEAVVVERGDSLPIVLHKLDAMGVGGGQALEWRALAKQLGAAGLLQV